MAERHQPISERFIHSIDEIQLIHKPPHQIYNYSLSAILVSFLPLHSPIIFSEKSQIAHHFTYRCSGMYLS